MEKIYKVNKNNLTSEEKADLQKHCKVIHSSEDTLVVKTKEKLNESKVEELNEMNEG